MRRLILRCHLSLGDIVVLTAALRDLHRCYPKQFLTDVDTSCREVWDHNPHLTPLDPAMEGVERLDCAYPLIGWSNQVPNHFLHGFIDHLNGQLGLEIKPTEFRGDIHLSNSEQKNASPVPGLSRVPYWLVMAGGKHDVTIKWWEPARYQQVVQHFRGRVQFVQIGQAGHFHPRLEGAIDLRGRTSIRDLIRLVHHSQGILCGVTGLMHLAAAVPVPKNQPGLRPCVVVAGGREPAHWEAYPGHEYLHTIGQLPCCASGGCWRSRTLPLGDGDPRDKPANLCIDVVKTLPRCMDLISADQVVARIESFLSGRKLKCLNATQKVRCQSLLRATPRNPIEESPLVAGNVRALMELQASRTPPFPKDSRGQGVILCAGGLRLFTCAWVNIRMLRHLGCTLPIELWHLGPGELNSPMKELLKPFGVSCVDAHRIALKHPIKRLGGWELKVFALWHTRFREVLLLDADNVPARDPSYLFDTPEYQKHGAIFWPDSPGSDLDPKAIQWCGLKEAGTRSFETGQIVLDRNKTWKALHLTLWLNHHSDFFYPFTWGDKETFRLGFHKAEKSYAMPRRSPEGRMRQYDFEGRLLFQHRNTDKWSMGMKHKRIPGFRYEKQCEQFVRELTRLWKTSPAGTSVQREFRSAGFRGTAALKPKGATAMPARITTARVPAVTRTRGGSLTLVTLFDPEMSKVGSLTSQCWKSYAEDWGFRWVCHRHVLNPKRHPAWNKILAVQQALREFSEPAMWVDADTVPMNHKIDARTLLPQHADIAFASDFNGLNAGIFLIRPSAWSRSFLESAWFLGDVRRAPDAYGDKWEQNTFKAMLSGFAEPRQHVAILPENTMNSSVASYRKGDFLIHLGGMSNSDRLIWLRQLLQPHPSVNSAPTDSTAANDE